MMWEVRSWRHVILPLAVVLILLLGVSGCGSSEEEAANGEEEAEEVTTTEEEMERLYTDDQWDEISNLALSPDGDTVVVESELYSLEEREVFFSKTGEDYIVPSTPCCTKIL